MIRLETGDFNPRGKPFFSLLFYLRTNVTVDTNDLQITVEYVKNKKASW